MARDILPTVLFLHPSDEMYGADRQLLALVRAARESCTPVVLIPDDLDYQGSLSAVLQDEGVEVLRGPLPVLRRRYARPAAFARWLLRSIVGWWWILREARARRARVIVSNSTGIPVGPSVALFRRGTHLWFVREVIQSPGWFRRMVRIAARLARGRVLTVSDAVGAWLGPIKGRGPATLHDGVNVDEDPIAMPDTPRAVFVGRMNEWKGWDVFVRAAALVHQQVPTATFRLVGGVVPGSDIGPRDVAAAIEAADSTGQWLEWVGEVPDASALMRDAWLVAVPSTRPDPFPNVVLEAMREARPVVGTDHGGIPEMVADGVTGTLVPPDDAQALASAMVAILSDRMLAERLGSAARARVVAEYSMATFERAWVQVLSEALGQPAQAAGAAGS